MPGTVQDLGKTLSKGRYDMPMKLTPMEPMKANRDGSPFNPFNQDFSAMGTQLSKELYIMHYNHPQSELRGAYLVNIITGERNKLTL
jgi:hypothetical protein